MMDELLRSRSGLFRLEVILAGAEGGGKDAEIALADRIAAAAFELGHHLECELAQEALLVGEVESERAVPAELLVSFPVLGHQLDRPLIEPVALLRQFAAAIEQRDQREQERVAAEIAHRAVRLQGPTKAFQPSRASVERAWKSEAMPAFEEGIDLLLIKILERIGREASVLQEGLHGACSDDPARHHTAPAVLLAQSRDHAGIVASRARV